MTTARELAKSLHTDYMVVAATLSQMGEFVPSEDTELAPSLVRRVKDSLPAGVHHSAVIKYDLEAPVSAGKIGPGKGDADAAEQTVLVPEDADADETVEVDVMTGDDGDSDAEDDSEDGDSKAEDGDEAEADAEDGSDSDADDSSSKQDEYDLSEDADADAEAEAEAEDARPTLYVDYETGTLQDLADEANTEVEYLISLAEAFGYERIDASAPASTHGGWLFAKITLLLGYQLRLPPERPAAPDNNELVGDLLNGDIQTLASIQVGDALVALCTGSIEFERVRAIFDEDNYSVSVAMGGSVVTILGVFGIEGEVYRFPHDRAARDWARSLR